MLYGEENHGYKNATRRVAGKKIKGRGGKKIKSDSRIYTPAKKAYVRPENANLKLERADLRLERDG